MVERIVWATLVLGIETIIIVFLNVAVVEARRLRTYWHHFWIYTIYVVQLAVWAVWMLPAVVSGFPFLTSNFPATWAPVTHVILGLIVGLLATILVLTFLLKPEINILKMKRAKPLMQTVYIGWTLNYLLGLFNYLNRYILTD